MTSMPRYELLIDSRTGLITQLREVELDPRLPRDATLWQATVADGRALTGYPSDRIASATYFDKERARLAAIGEAVERYAGNYIGLPLVCGTYWDMVRRGYRALDPAEIPLYSRSQYRQKNFPFVPLTRDLPIRWVQGYSLTRRQELWVPASLVFVNYYYGQYASEPRTNFVMYAGIAAGPSLEAAIVSGLLELIERDATAIWWASGVRLPAIAIHCYRSLYERLQPRDSSSSISFRLFDITVDIPVPVIAAMLYDPQSQIICIGFACRPDAEEAAFKAVCEAIQLHVAWSSLLDPESNTWQAMRRGMLHSAALRPYRPDRSYRQAFHADYRDMTDLWHHGQFYLDPSTHYLLSDLICAEEEATLQHPCGSSRLDDLVGLLAERNLECIYVDVTPPDILDVGLRVVRTLVPGLVPNAPAAFPYLGPPRLYTVPVKMGWREGPLMEEELRRDPLPHS